MRFLKSKHTLTVVFLSLITSLSAQDEMDFYWATFSSGYGLNQTGQVVELYSCELPSREFIPYAKISLSDKYPSPNLWAHYGEFIYGFSNSNDFTRVQRINWHTKKSLGARILHPKVSELFDEKLYVLEKSSADGVVLIRPLQRRAVILDLENNKAYYASIPNEVAIDSTKILTKWISGIKPEKLETTYAFRGIDLMEKAYAILGLVLALLLVGFGNFFLINRKNFRLNKKELSNRFKKIPLTIEMYHFLCILAKQKEIKNQALLDLFFQAELTPDSILKRKNKMIGELMELTNDCFKIQLFKKKKDPNDRRETIYSLNPRITIKVTES
jgi:DNA-binding MarR family transcriptional regulator